MVQFISLEKKIYFGVRDTNLDLTVYASKDPYTVDIMETGHQTAMMLALLASMKDDDGRVNKFMMM
jgi:hypothetical protein